MPSQEVSQLPKGQPRFYYGYVIVAVAFLIMLVIGGALYTFGVFLSRYQVSLAGPEQPPLELSPYICCYMVFFTSSPGS